MGRNKHIFVVTTTTAQDACKEVEDWLVGQGLRSVLGAVNSTNNELYINDPDWQGYPEDYHTIENINLRMRELLFDKGFEDVLDDLLPKATSRTASSEDWLRLSEVCRHKHVVSGLEEFNILEDEYMASEYDQFGVTHVDDGSGLTLFVVYAEMYH